MKFQLRFLLFALLLSVSCSHEPTVSLVPFGIDFQSSFENDHVRLVIGGGEVLNRNLQTNHLLGVCVDGGQLSFTQPKGNVPMTVTINGSITKSETFVLSRARYVGISFNRQTNEIMFQYSDEPFVYD